MGKAILTTKVDPAYDDLPETHYHFPRTYLRQVEAALNDWIIYYEPRRSSGDLSSRGGRQCYFATARVIRIVPDPTRADYFYAYVDSYLEFVRPVPFREGGNYYEAVLRREDGETSKGAFGRSARYLPESEYEAILRAGFVRILEESRSKELKIESHPRGFSEPPAEFERPIVERVISRPFRDAAFSGTVKTAYADRCAFTGLKIINGGGRSEVQAAHVRPVASNGPDSLRNGLALCSTVHWMFDRGLISISDDHTLLLAKGHVPEQAARLLNPDRMMLAPPRADQAPHPLFLRWHRENVFKG
jgi:putative restriction endonuclease